MSGGTVASAQKISNSAGNLSFALDSYDRFGYSIAGLGDVNGDGDLATRLIYRRSAIEIGISARSA